MILAAPLVQRSDRLMHIFRSHFFKRTPIVHRAPVRLFVQLEQGTAKRRFSAAGLANQSKRFTLVDIDAYSIISLNKSAALDREVLFKVADAEQNFFIFFHGSFSPSFQDRST